MKSTQILDARRNIRKEIVAFASIVVIGLLAALAYLGIAYTAATLKKDAVHFFNANEFWDAEVTSTMLMTEEDLETIRAIPGISAVEPVWQIDTKLNTDGSNQNVTITNLPEAISLPVLQEGQFPSDVNECAIEKNLADNLGLAIGQKLNLDCDKIMDIDPLLESSFVITGIFFTPDHFSYMVPVTPYIFVTKDCFNREGFDGAFMKIRIRLENAPDNRYSDEYQKLVKSVTDALETLAGTRAPARSEEIRRGFEDKIRDGEAQIESGREELQQAKQKIEDGKANLAASEEKLGKMKMLIDYAEPQLIAGKDKLEAAREKLKMADEFLGEADAYLHGQNKSGIDEIPESDWPAEAGISYEEFQQMLEQKSPDEIMDFLREKSGYNRLKEEFRNAEELYETLRNSWYYSGEQYLDGLTLYEKGKKQLEDGQRQAEEGEEKLRKAEEELRRAKAQLGEIADCRWVVLNNNSNPGFIYAAANADKLSSLSMSFSTIFLVVGVLVIYATISRMVEQQRRQIGVNKALGLFNREIFAKYLLFACSAVVLGVGIGILLAWLPMQRAVLRSYEAHLNYGVGTRSFLLRDTGFVAAGAVAISVIAVYMGCSRLLRQPALKLIQGSDSDSARRKTSGSSAKKSLYFRLIVRNMMTDWNRVLVTIVSIAGGCVLMVVGFTLRYGISGVPDKQFGEIMTYDAEVFFSTKENTEAAAELEDILNRYALEHVSVRKESTVFEMDETLNALTLITSEPGSLEGFYALQDIRSGKPAELPKSGALVPRRFWEYYGIDVGEDVTVYDAELIRRNLKVAGIFENYYGQLFFLTPQAYEEAFGSAPENNCLLVKTGEMTLEQLRQILAGVDGLVNVNDAAAERTMIEQFTSSLNFVVYLMLFIAGMMACFIVANFTMTFIQRKTRELTIMRINGFTSNECIRYVAVDLVITTVLGTLVGMVVGAFMGARILGVTETPYIQMIREPRPETFLFAALATFVFSALTNGFALRRVRNLKLTDLG